MMRLVFYYCATGASNKKEKLVKGSFIAQALGLLIRLIKYSWHSQCIIVFLFNHFVFYIDNLDYSMNEDNSGSQVVEHFPQVECLFIKVPFHQNGFSSNGLFIECTIVSSFQNCKQNFCSTSASKVIDDLVRVTLKPITNSQPIWS
jgi:hypothetical protein